MENDNLIEFTSPSNSPFTNNNDQHQMPIITSSNPFDEPPINFVDYPTQFVSPSKINFEDFNCGNFLHRESLIGGRESLLLQFQSAENYGRESLGILDLDDLDLRRESLGIERLKITKKPINNNDILNQALLYSMEDSNDSVFNSTTPTNPSFNSNSLRNNSSLFSISSIKVTDLTTTATNILNKRFYNSNELYDRLKFSTKFNHFNRITSLPESQTINEDGDDDNHKLWNSAIITTIKTPPSKNNEDLDPILIEARHFADHIENGSIFNEKLDDIYTLEHTRQPDLVDNSFDNLQEYSPQKSCEIINESNQQNSNLQTIKDPRELLNSLSVILNTNNQQEGQVLLNSLANILLSKSNSPPSSSLLLDDDHDDSGNSSIDNPQQQQQLINNECCYEVLDLRLKTSQDHSKSSGSDDLPLDLSIKSLKEHEFVQPKIILTKSDNHQKTNNRSSYNNNNLSSSSSTSSISQNDNTKYSFNNSSSCSLLKIKKNDEKKRMGPLKAVIPIDNMMKTSVLYNQTTPTTDNKLKKTSTPINDPKMRPMAQSTPDTPSNNNNNKWKLSPLQPSTTTTTTDQNLKTSTESKCRLNYSDSTTDQSKSINKTTNSSDNRKLRYSLNEEQQQQQQRPKSFLQRRSLSDLKRSQITKTEQQHQQQGIPRSYSAGKDPKILSSLKRVRQNINKSDKTKSSHRSTEKDTNIDKTKTKVLNENKSRIGGNIGNKSLMVKKTVGKENR